MSPEYSLLGSIGVNWGIDNCENTFASFSQWFVISITVFITGNIRPFL